MFSRSVLIFSGIFVTCSACAQSKPQSKWDNIDYSNVYRSAGERQIDNTYQQPSVLGCVDDDLFNCK